MIIRSRNHGPSPCRAILGDPICDGVDPQSAYPRLVCAFCAVCAVCAVCPVCACLCQAATRFFGGGGREGESKVRSKCSGFHPSTCEGQPPKRLSMRRIRRSPSWRRPEPSLSLRVPPGWDCPINQWVAKFYFIFFLPCDPCFHRPT